ncbi:hypothetical protein [Alicyclobacillus vulcanalis]|uniref:TrkA-N domain-containing protein n=1 Tax=Alicyclobacillus vulcanalis TaxID=252246 RepID=A0A1N7NWP8_9BACL|nr:hypothetical protein [Alicyclobacillus vulcanalis]SIT02722.1 hypothetical protein SAMN05421799_11024 [Alicyclobacillus vulcanalis]
MKKGRKDILRANERLVHVGHKLLMVACSDSDRWFVDRAVAAGFDVRLLVCFEDIQHKARAWHPDRLLEVPAHKASVTEAVRGQRFEAACVCELGDPIRTALVVQALRDASVPRVVVLTRHAARAPLYARSGAHDVICAEERDHVWTTFLHGMSVQEPAS